MALSERVARLLVAGLLCGIFIGLLRGDVWSVYTLREAGMFAVLLGALMLIDRGVRRFVNRNVERRQLDPPAE